MHIFKQQHTGNWEIALTVKLMRKVEAVTGINLGLPDFGNPPTFARMCADAVLVGEILWVLCEEQGKAKGIPEDQFHEDIIIGAVFEEAHKALLQEWRDFFLARSIGGTGQRLQVAIEGFFALMSSGKSSTNSPATSGSTPATSP